MNFNFSIGRSSLILALIFVGLFAVLPAEAEFLLSAEGTSVQGDLTSTASTSHSQTYVEGGAMWGFSQRTPFYFGLIYSSYGSSDKDLSNATAVFLSQDYFIGAKYFFGRDRQLGLTAAYGILSTANYKLDSNPTETWSGTSTLFKISYRFFVSNSISLSASLGYYKATYIKKDVGGVSTSFSGSKTFLLPILGLNFGF